MQFESPTRNPGVKPYISIAMILLTFLALVFLSMEQRRQGYELLKVSKELRKLEEQKRLKLMLLAKQTRPQLVERMAHSRLDMKRLSVDQIIQMPLSGLVQDSN